jgi:hypothetical protein
MQKQGNPSLKCGKVFNVILSNDLTNYDLPITLAKVKVKTGKIVSPCILLNYSSVLETAVAGFNPILNVVYRLVRRSHRTGKTKILEEWNLSAAELIPTTVQGSLSIEPLVLNFCDCQASHSDESFTYILQLTNITLNNMTLAFTNQQFSAIVSPGEAE